MKKVLRMTDNEMDEMQRQINKEEGLDPDEGGIDIPSGYRWCYTIPITRWHSHTSQTMLPNMMVKK